MKNEEELVQKEEKLRYGSSCRWKRNKGEIKGKNLILKL